MTGGIAINLASKWKVSEFDGTQNLISGEKGIFNNGKYGMASLSLNGGVSNQINYGVVGQSIGENSKTKVENMGGEEKIYYTLKTGEQEGQALFYENQNGMKNNGNYGISVLAQNNGQAEGINTINIKKLNQGCTLDSGGRICQDPNKPFILEPILGIGLVENNGYLGMIGIALENGDSLLVNEGIDFFYKSNYTNDKIENTTKINIELSGGVKNKGGPH